VYETGENLKSKTQSQGLSRIQET